MSYTDTAVKPKDIRAHMKNTLSIWPEFTSWLNKHKKRKNPMSLFEVMELSGNPEFVFQAARALPEHTHGNGRKLAVAFAIGRRELLSEIALDDRKLGKGYRHLMDACLAQSDDLIPTGELKDIRWKFANDAVNAYPRKVRAAADAMIAAASPYAWGGAAVARRRALDALQYIHTKTIPMRSHDLDFGHVNLQAVDYHECKLLAQIAWRMEEKYQTACLRHICHVV